MEQGPFSHQAISKQCTCYQDGGQGREHRPFHQARPAVLPRCERCFFQDPPSPVGMGHQTEESQFLDASNANIKNVFSAEDQAQQPQVEAHRQAAEMVRLEDLHLDGDLADMSRISMGQAAPDEGAQNQILNETQQELMNFEQLNHRGLPPSGRPEFQPVATQPPPEEPIRQPAPSTEWKKVTFAKKKKFANRQAAQPAPIVPSSDVPEIQIQQELNIDDIQLDLPVQPSRPAEPSPKASKKQTNKYVSSTSEPLPLFDCLFCAGIHEHLVLQTVKEKQLKTIYGQTYAFNPEQRNRGDCSYEEFNQEFYEDIEHLSRLFVIDILANQLEVRLNAGVQNLSLVKEETSQSEQAGVTPVFDSWAQLKQIASQPGRSYKPLQAQVDRRMKEIARVKAPTEAKPVALKNAREEGSDSENENMNLVSNILDNFEDIDPEEQSMFMNLNIRNRRQKILHNISFETEFYDVYNPVFTSEEESSSSSGSSSEEQSSNSYAQEDHASGMDRTSNGQNSKGSIYGSSVGSSSQLSEHIMKDYHKAVDKKSVINEQDLDYNSENNNSSLSSIHREIQEVPEQSNSGILPQKQSSGKSKGSKKAEQLEMETGGCQFEEMQDDTVMDKCKAMFQKSSASPENVRNSDAFREQILLQRKSNLNQQLNDLDHLNMLALQQMVSDSKLLETGRSDLDDLPAECMEMLVDDNNLLNPNVHQLMINSLNNSSQFKKTTGRFNNQFLMSSEKSQKHAMMTSKKFQSKVSNRYSNPNSDHHNLGEKDQKAHEDSIIRIMPGLPNRFPETAAEVMEEVDEQLDELNQPVGMASFGDQNNISPVGHVEDSQSKIKIQLQKIEIEQLPATAAPPEVQEESSSKGNEIQIHDHENPITNVLNGKAQNIMVDQSSSANLSDYLQQEKLTSSKLNKLQLVDSDDDEVVISPIGNKVKPNVHIFDDLDSSRGRNQYRKQISKSKLNSPTKKQQANLKSNDLKKFSNSAKKNVLAKGSTQKLQSRNLPQEKYSLNCNAPTLINTKVTQRIQSGNLISASLGQLPAFHTKIPDTQKRISQKAQALLKSESQGIIRKADEEELKAKQTYNTKNATKPKHEENTTPHKARVVQAAIMKSQQVHTQKVQKYLAAKPNSKAGDAPTKSGLKIMKSNEKQAASTNNFGMLSKEQIKQMKQLQKQMNNEQPKPSKVSENRKNVIDNYFKVGQEVLEFEALQQKSAGTAFAKKRSVTNIKGRHLEPSLDKNEHKDGKFSKQQLLSNVDGNKYRCSMVDINLYNQQTAHDMAASAKQGKVAQHNQCSSQSLDKHQNLLMTEQKSDPSKKPLDVQGAGKKGDQKRPQDAKSNDYASHIGFSSAASQAQFQTKKQLKKTSKNSKQQQSNAQLVQSKKLDLIKLQKPIGDVRQIKYHKFQSVKEKGDSAGQAKGVMDHHYPLNQAIPSNKAKQGSKISTQNSILYSSTSQLENVSLPNNEKNIVNPLFRNLVSKLGEQSLFNDENTQFMLPAQSHRNPHRSAQQKLSISADKSTNKNTKELMKSSINLQQNFSQIQNESNLDSKSKLQLINNSKQQESKLSIERDIKFLKMSLQGKLGIEQTQKLHAQTVAQNNRLYKLQAGGKQVENSQNLETISENHNQHTSHVSNRHSQINSSLDVHPSTNSKLRDNSKGKIQTKQLKLKKKQTKSSLKVSQTAATTDQKPQELADLISIPTSTKHSHQEPKEDDGSKASKYKKLILENNQKILQFKQNNSQGTSQGATPKAESTLSQQFKPVSFLQKKMVGVQKAQMQFQGLQIEEGELNAPEPVFAKVNSLQNPKGGSSQYFQIMKNNRAKKMAKGLSEKEKSSLQYFKTNEENSSNDVLNIDGSGSSGLGLISSGEQNIHEDRLNKNFQNQQFNSSANNANQSSSLFTASMMNPNVTQAHKQKQKSIGSHQNMLGMTQTGHGSIITTGQTGLGLTTFLKSNGNANTTVSSNTIQIRQQQEWDWKPAEEHSAPKLQHALDQAGTGKFQAKNVKVLRKQPTIQNSESVQAFAKEAKLGRNQKKSFGKLPSKFNDNFEM